MSRSLATTVSSHIAQGEGGAFTLESRLVFCRQSLRSFPASKHALRLVVEVKFVELFELLLARKDADFVRYIRFGTGVRVSAVSPSLHATAASMARPPIALVIPIAATRPDHGLTEL